MAAREPRLAWLAVEWAILSGTTAWIKNRRDTAVATVRLRGERLEEEIRSAQADLRILEETGRALSERLGQYQRLEEVTRRFGELLSLDALLSEIVKQTAQLVRADLVILYTVSPPQLALELKGVWRRGEYLPIKAKTGDSFDSWVVRQRQALLVQDIQKEFRFPKPSTKELGREVHSLMGVPLFSQEQVLGVLRVEAATAHAFSDAELRLVRIVGDLSSLAIENARLYGRVYELAITDEVTGLAVRSHFEKRFAHEMERAHARKDEPVSLLMIDIDRFKDYNDHFGHSAGDKLLRRIGQILRESARHGEIVGRFGGEEFTCLLPGVTRERACERAEKIRLKVEETPVQLRRSVTKTTVSIGVASFPEDGLTPRQLLQAADERLYQAKSMGRNRVC